MGISKTRSPLWKELKRRVALFLSIALISGNLGMIAPRAETRKQEPDEPVILKIQELPESIREQRVSLGTSKEDLNLPNTLEVSTATSSNGERASSSDAISDNWEQVPVDWTFFYADNGEDYYNKEVKGTYFFEADLTGSYPIASYVELPVISVTVSEQADIEEGDIICRFIDLGDTLTSAEPSISLFSTSNGKVELTGGTSEKWIDRIILPSYAKDLYNRLIEGSDNDGVDDFLIGNSYFSSSTATTINSYTFNGIQIYQTTKNSEMSEEENAYILAAIRAAFDAFDRDHPEVFWLSGRTYAFSVRQRTNDQYRYTYYFPLKTHSGFKQSFDIRASQYQNESRIKTDIRTRDRQVNTILGTLTDDSSTTQIVQLNEWLTTHNEYNTTKGSDYPWESRKSITALVGNSGINGPVCEGYARAFKVLCDELSIPCVLVDGQTSGGGHMWNYAQVEGNWYAVDVTWNDPTGGKSGAISGSENTSWLLLGSDTVVRGERFIDSHPVSNTASNNGVSFTNGPALSRNRYPLKPIPKVTFPFSSRLMTYTGQPVTKDTLGTPTVTVNGEAKSPTLRYSYQRSGSTDYIDGLPTNAGTYTIRAQVPASDEYFSSSGYMTLTIQKATPTLTVSSSYSRSKTYDGKPCGIPSASQVTVTNASYGNVKFTWYKNSVSDSNRLNSAPSNAGTYILVASIDETENTQAVSVRITVTINRQKIALAANPAAKSYGDPDPQLTCRLTGGALIGGDSLRGSLSRQSGEDAGTYAISQGTLTNSNNPNYDITFQPGIFTIRKASRVHSPEVVTVTDHEAELIPVNLGNGGGTVEYGYAATNNIGQVSWQGGSTRFSGLAPGTTYFFFVRVSGSANYEDSWGSVGITTRKTILPLPTAAQNYVYTGSSITVNMAGYDPNLMTMTGTTSGTNAGNYTAQFQLKNPAQYAWESQSENTSLTTVTWSIARKPVTVKAANKSRSPQTDNPNLTLETPADGVLEGDDTIEDLKVTLSTTAQKNSPVGTYPITGVAASDTNYLVTIEPGTLTIARSSSGGGGGGGGGATNKNPNTTAAVPAPGSGTTGSWSGDGHRWRFLDSVGSYIAGRIEIDSQGNPREYITWSLINNRWWAFGADSYAKEGWILDAGSNLWYNIDINSGMNTGWYRDGGDSNWYLLDSANGNMLVGWHQVNGVWYYLNPVSGAGGKPQGAMYHNEWTPDGYFVNEDGSWTGR